MASLKDCLKNFFIPWYFEDLVYSQFGKAEKISIPIIPKFPAFPTLKSYPQEIEGYQAENFVFVKAYNKDALFLSTLAYSFGINFKEKGKKLYIFTDEQSKIDHPNYVNIIQTKNTKEDLYKALKELKAKLIPEPEQPKPYVVYNLEEEPEIFKISKHLKDPRTSLFKNLPIRIYKIHEFFR